MRRLFPVLKLPMLGRQEDGFSLIEMAIVIAIMGMLISLSVPMWMRHLDQSKLTLTRQWQEDILKSLGSYVARQKALPCPADPSLAQGQKGWARLQCLRKPEAVGLVPFRELGLSEDAARDGYGRFFTYAIEPYLSPQEEAPDFTHFCRQPGGQLKVYEATGKYVGERPNGRLSPTSFVAVVLISHGENGHGAYTDQGTILRAPGIVGEGERLNSEKSALIFAAYPYSVTPQNPFRHIVSWVTRDNFLSYYAHRVCGEGER
jgi:prepilin-type N-terminal cleavage/methylation domain-containing protein